MPPIHPMQLKPYGALVLEVGAHGLGDHVHRSLARAVGVEAAGAVVADGPHACADHRYLRS